MARVLIDKDTQKKIYIESGKGLKTIRRFISDDARIPDFLGGQCRLGVLANPGLASGDLNNALCKLDIESVDTDNLKRYFWDVDMSKPGNWLGVEAPSRGSCKWGEMLSDGRKKQDKRTNSTQSTQNEAEHGRSETEEELFSKYFRVIEAGERERPRSRIVADRSTKFFSQMLRKGSRVDAKGKSPRI